MGETTLWRNLASVAPESETQWRSLMAVVYRVIGQAGCEAAAKTHELMIREIREGRSEGSSTIAHFCPKCRERGSKTFLLHIGSELRCGTCGYVHTKRSG